MTTTNDTLVLKTGDLGEVLGLLGVLCGFQPTDSLIVMALTGQRRRMTFMIRTDLVEPSQAPDVAQLVGDHLAQHGAESVLVIAVGADVERCDAAVGAVFADCRDRGLVVADAARAHDGWYRTYDDYGDPGIDPPRPFDAQSSPRALEARMHGATVAPSREALLAMFSPPDPERAATLAPWFEQAAQEVADFAAAHSQEAFVERGMVVHDRLRGSGERLGDADIARLAVWVAAHLMIRDHAWSRLSRATAGEDLAFWRFMVTNTIAPYEPAVLSLCGVAAWLEGQGAVAREVWERAVTADPDYTMAPLMIEGLERGVPPAVLDGLFPSPLR